MDQNNDLYDSDLCNEWKDLRISSMDFDPYLIDADINTETIKRPIDIFESIVAIFVQISFT